MTDDLQNFADEEEQNAPQTMKGKVKEKSDEPKVIAEKEKALKQRHNVKATKTTPEMTPTKTTTPKKKSTAKAKIGKFEAASDEAFSAAIGYIPPLFLIPLLSKKDSKFCQFHAKQSMSIFIVMIIYLLITWVFLSNISIQANSPAWWILFFMRICFLVLFAVGFINAFQGKEFRYPFFSQMADQIKV